MRARASKARAGAAAPTLRRARSGRVPPAAPGVHQRGDGVKGVRRRPSGPTARVPAAARVVGTRRQPLGAALPAGSARRRSLDAIRFRDRLARGVTCGKGGRLARRPAASAPRARPAARRLGRPRRAVEVWADSVHGNTRRGTSAFLHTFVSGRYHRGAAPQRRFRCGPASLRSPPPRRRSAHRIPRRRAAERGAAVKRLSRGNAEAPSAPNLAYPRTTRRPRPPRRPAPPREPTSPRK